MRRYVKKTPNPTNGRYVSNSGKRIDDDVETFPIMGVDYSRLGQYCESGGSLSVMLIIRFQLESCALFVMASIVSTYQAYDNTQRNGLRNACRLAHLSG